MAQSPDDNIRANYALWDSNYDWPEDGDEWKGQAALCGLPYDDWKASLVDHLIRPYVHGNVIEIGGGHGRWSEHIIPLSERCMLVDLSSSCLAFCRNRFGHLQNVEYFLTPGTSLPYFASGRVDCVWSYDAFVHMAPEVVSGYLESIARVLRLGGRAVLHHANVPNPENHDQDLYPNPGWRSAVDASMVRQMAEAQGLRVVGQFVYWDSERRVGVPNYDDRVTIVEKRGRKPWWRWSLKMLRS